MVSSPAASEPGGSLAGSRGGVRLAVLGQGSSQELETAKGVVTVASARALATKRLSRAGGGKAKWVPR